MLNLLRFSDNYQPIVSWQKHSIVLVRPVPHSQWNFRKSNRIEHRTLYEFDLRTNRNQSNETELDKLDCVRLGSAAELNQTQSFHCVRWVNSLGRRLCYVVSKTRKTWVTLKTLESQKTCYWFSTPVLRKSRVQKPKVRFSSIAGFDRTQIHDWALLSMPGIFVNSLFNNETSVSSNCSKPLVKIRHQS